MTSPNDSSQSLLTALLARVAQGDELALKQLYDLTSARFYGLALRIVRVGELAEDVLQESYLSIWRSAADFRASLSPPLAWMGLIVRSRALDLLRRRNAERTPLTDPLDEVIEDTLEGDSPDPLHSADASQQARALQQCLNQLKGPQREVLSLAYLRELSHSELAEQLKLPLGTIKSWIRRGLEQLRMCMGAWQ
ncbi:sigma-70 family RNA polymerase sigma factor [Curvibacter sp. RS43]|jgi:RNA polymerase sigma factor (sigma-70 family)|uniref:Sigma-70 family RNA polymerase sigma factor n=1 Tax=Curvibacter microcysteis TaxID=3026419 RepID=A0ABT5MEY4_9BURK|nr:MULTISPECIES: sigma-70 family RNA polymerase sigma factor [unclassified Curvibacter]MDD0809963.1 sigma-70 family RNA polymerase sigma factor [Curvibacter sp. RS43]MDD0815138.1 sigma-70 family RNA polymerase sigma factor [Curvibacter sp. HBC28]